jgi:uncharacterized protein
MSLQPDLADPMQPVPSPCIDICRMDPVSGLCEGCKRTLDEIARWSGMDAVAKRRVWEQLAARGPRTDAGKDLSQ